MSAPHASAARPRVAVIGAGLAGLACARALAAGGLSVTVLEKSRGPGGRAATRRATLPDERALAFDHGAQYCTARDPRFVAQIEAWAGEGIAAEWTGRIAAVSGGVVGQAGAARRWVGVPGMSALGRALARGLDVRTGVRVLAVDRAGAQWTLRDDAGEPLGAFDAVVVAVPAPQAVPLLGGAPALARRAAAVEMVPCWSAMLAVSASLDLPFEAAFVNAAPDARPLPHAPRGDGSLAGRGGTVLGWVARDDAKPGRTRPAGVAETWVLHATPAWSTRHLEHAAGDVAGALLAAFAREAGVAHHAPIVHLAAHRWRYATPTPLAEPALWDDARSIGACGDWCGGPRVEGAYLSGLAAAERVLAWAGAHAARVP